MRRTLKHLYQLFLLFICLSHMAVGQTTNEERMEKDSIARHLTPIPDKAIVFIVRPSIYGFAIPMRLDCDSFQVGWIRAKTYLYTILDSGQHVFKARSENEFHLTLVLEPGQIYFLEQEVKTGWLYARTKLKLLSEVEGRNLLSRCKISKENRYPLFPYSKDVEKSPPKDN